ncbi:hypothetical protein GGI19_000008 [Coemansia pectinata]|uniref:Myb-like domain-containing protein n=1 Tax=Coemansia pectinata TaxID=1052879 RepID=A0A9W8LES6_9FUNG|nr:hypothetical protein GGI19_000008 [Coemansia pectinata]
MLSVAPYDGIVFPQVNKLTIIIHYSAWREGWKHSYDGLKYDIEYNINKFIGRVKQILPGINKVVVDNRYESIHSPARPSADIQKAIVKEVRLLQQHDNSIPWYRLAAKHRLSIEALQSIYNQAEVDAQRRYQQSALVTRAAERHFDSALGQFNWEAVASELDITLIECLDLFDASNSTIQPRSLIETYGGWSKTDMVALKQFIADNYADGSTVDWKLAGTYMNVDALECQRIGLGTFKGPINEVGYRRICELRKSKLNWKDIYQHFLQYPSVTSLHARYYRFKAKLEGVTSVRLTAEWTDIERERAKDLIKQHMKSTTRSELADIIQRELPARPLSDIRTFSYRHVREFKVGRMHADQMVRLRELVDEYGEDWDRIGKELDVLPSRAQRNWFEYGGDVGNRSAWSADETRQLQHLIDSGVKAKEAAKLLRVGSLRAYYYKMAETKSVDLQQRDYALSNSPWAAADDEALLKMVNESTTSVSAKWDQASKDLGRSVIACIYRFKVLHRSRIDITDDRESLVTNEVQRQCESSSAVDWSQVSQATGLDVRECLELSLYDSGKARWQYDPDSFSQSMVDQMTGFIKEHYPAPVPVNYRAVSNYMWVSIEDCIHIHDMLQGKFKWTKADYERATVLRVQGLSFNEVARHLSPTLSRQNVSKALREYSTPKPAREPISADELDQVSRLVDEYAGKYTVDEIIDKIRTQLHLKNRRDWHSLTTSRISAHSHYQAKSRAIDYNDLASRISTGQTTVKLAAKELDVPRPIVPGVFCRFYNGHPSYHLSKDLSIHIELGCIYSGKALALLSRAPYRDCVFPLVRSVSFTSDMIIMRKGRDIYASCAHDNIAAFVQRLRQMTPRAHEFNLGVYMRVSWPENTMGHFGSLVNQILQYTSRFKNSLLDYRRPIALNFDGICNLAHIDYALDPNRELCFQLARQCVSTLQYLRLWSKAFKYERHLDISRLIRGDDGICVEYSRLQKLILDNDLTMLQRPVLGTFVAFPALRHLSIKYEYPFGDDTLFRGNAATLAYLRMRMHGSTATILRERRVFTRSSHPKLQSVAIIAAYNFVPNFFAINTDYMQFALSIGSKAAARVIYGLSCVQDISRSLQLLGEHKSIRILALNQPRLLFLDVVALIKSLPLLSDFSSDPQSWTRI